MFYDEQEPTAVKTAVGIVFKLSLFVVAIASGFLAGVNTFAAVSQAPSPLWILAGPLCLISLVATYVAVIIGGCWLTAAVAKAYMKRRKPKYELRVFDANRNFPGGSSDRTSD